MASIEELRTAAEVTARALATRVVTDTEPPALPGLVFHQKVGEEARITTDWPAQVIIRDMHLHAADGTRDKAELGSFIIKVANGTAEYDVTDYYPAKDSRVDGWAVCTLTRGTYDG